MFTCNIVIVLSFLFVSEIRVNQGQTDTACTFHTLNLEDIFTLPSVPARIEILGHSETVCKTSMFLFREQCLVTCEIVLQFILANSYLHHGGRAFVPVDFLLVGFLGSVFSGIGSFCKGSAVG